MQSLMKALSALFVSKRASDQDEHKCPCCSRQMSYFPHLPIASGQGIAPSVSAWRCIFCGR